ncbi:lysocardiolipin acyltransferase 1-like isoform X2 [Corticium candelabrum]|nr:lysocardiolipin acyltransferase 1-like isoform X2 [Corticium candelabrum]
MKVVVTGDRLAWNEGCVIVMNHRTQMDWILLWNLLARFGDVRRCKIILKNSLRRFPGPGWAMQQCMFLFLARNWQKDRHHFNSMLNYFVETNSPIQILLFPEGTDFCERSKKRSDDYAKQRDLPNYDYVLHPRTKGFSELVKIMQHGNIKSVIDVSIAYPVNIPWGARSILLGNFPEQVHFDMKRYPIDEMLTDGESLEEWCRQRWEKKEENLRAFYETGKFDKPEIKSVVPEKEMWRKMAICLILWAALAITSVFLVFLSSLWCWFCVLGSAIYMGLTLFGGVEKSVLDAHNRMYQRPQQHRET